MEIYLDFQSKNKRMLLLLKKFNLKHNKNCAIALRINQSSLEIYDRSKYDISPVKIDFISKKTSYRCYHATIKKEKLAQAIGMKHNFFPFVLDATAGMGKDAFILSFLGCKVIMVERNPIMAVLLKNGLERAYLDQKHGLWIKKRLHLIYNDSINILSRSILKPDVIYLDPMYPARNKKSLPKKDMQLLQKFIGQDLDSSQLLYFSRKYAQKRIVVKRPLYAEPISQKKADFIIISKNHRFDIYYPILKN